MIDRVEVQDSSPIEPEMIGVIGLGCRMENNLHAESHRGRQVPLNFQTQENRVFVPRAGMGTITSPTETRPGPPAFLEPKRDQKLGLPTSQSPGKRHRSERLREGRRPLRELRGLLEKTVFHPQFGIAVTVVLSSTPGKEG